MKFNKVEAHYSLVEEKENNNIGDDTLGASDKELKYRRPNFDERECPYRTNSIKEEITSQVVYVPLDIFNTVTLLLSIITLLFIFDLYLRFRDVQNGDLNSDSFIIRFLQLSVEDRSRLVQFLRRTKV